MKTPDDDSSAFTHHDYMPDYTNTFVPLDQEVFTRLTSWVPGLMSNRRALRNSVPASVVSPWHQAASRSLTPAVQARLRQSLQEAAASLEKASATVQVHDLASVEDAVQKNVATSHALTEAQNQLAAFARLLEEYAPNVLEHSSVTTIRVAADAGFRRVEQAARTLLAVLDANQALLVANQVATEGPAYLPASPRAVNATLTAARHFAAMMMLPRNAANVQRTLEQYDVFSEDLLLLLREGRKQLSGSMAEPARQQALQTASEAQQELHSAMAYYITAYQLLEATSKALKPPTHTSTLDAFNEARADLLASLRGFRHRLRAKTGEKMFNRTLMFLEQDLQEVADKYLAGGNKPTPDQLAEPQQKLEAAHADLLRAMGNDETAQADFSHSFQHLLYTLGVGPAPISRIEFLRNRLRNL